MSQEAAGTRATRLFAASGGDTDDRTRVSERSAAPEQLGDFRLVSKLAEGGMGVVYKARQVSMDRDVALKILPEQLARDPDYVDRFYREARMSAKLDHPNIVRGIAVGEANGAHYFAMELIDGESTDKLLARRGKLPVREALKIGIDVARALDHAQSKGMVHRDIKPANIMITRDGTVKLADLGLAKTVADDVGLTQAGVIFGTPSYMAPEQAEDAKGADTRSDIYALGGTLYHLLTGKRPFEGGTTFKVLAAKEQGTPTPARQYNPEVSDRLERIINKMLAPDPDQRFQNPAEVIAALEEVAAGDETVTGRTTTVTGRRTRAGSGSAAWGKRRLSLLWPALAMILLLAAGGAGYFAWSFWTRPAPEMPQPRRTDAEAREILGRAFAKVRVGAVEQARDLLAKELADHPGEQEIERPLRELQHGVLILFEYQTPSGTSLLPIWSPERIALTPRDNYRFAIIASRECYVYAFQKDTQPSVTGLFPNIEYSKQVNPLREGQTHWLPSAPMAEGLWLHLDASVGEETVYFLALSKPLRDVGAFTRRILDSEDKLREDLQTNLDSFLQPGEPAGASCFADGVLQVLPFDHK